jgi:octaprenyl-diphosphate synthase
MQQVANRGNFDLDEDSYFTIIRGKTAELTAVSCRLGAQYAGAPPETVAALDDFGRSLGVAFQIADDILDIWGEERTTGKSLGTDLEKQKLTLPLIRLLATAPPATAAMVRNLLADETAPPPDCRRALRSFLVDSDALEFSWDRAREQTDRARAALDCLADSDARNVLHNLTEYVIRRSS